MFLSAFHFCTTQFLGQPDVRHLSKCICVNTLVLVSGESLWLRFTGSLQLDGNRLLRKSHNQVLLLQLL